MVLPRLDDGEQHAARVHVGEVRVGGMSAELGDVDVAVAGRRVVEGVEEPARRVVGREGDRQEPGLARDLDLLAQVEERRGEDLAVADDPHGSGLLDDEESMRVPGRRGDEHGSVEGSDTRRGDEIGAVDRRRRLGGRRLRRDAEGALHAETCVPGDRAQERERSLLSKRRGDDLTLPRSKHACPLHVSDDEVVHGVATVSNDEPDRRAGRNGTPGQREREVARVHANRVGARPAQGTLRRTAASHREPPPLRPTELERVARRLPRTQGYVHEAPTLTTLTESLGRRRHRTRAAIGVSVPLSTR